MYTSGRDDELIGWIRRYLVAEACTFQRDAGTERQDAERRIPLDAVQHEIDRIIECQASMLDELRDFPERHCGNGETLAFGVRG